MVYWYVWPMPYSLAPNRPEKWGCETLLLTYSSAPNSGVGPNKCVVTILLFWIRHPSLHPWAILGHCSAIWDSFGLLTLDSDKNKIWQRIWLLLSSDWLRDLSCQSQNFSEMVQVAPQ